MKYLCMNCRETFRRFSRGSGVCPKCGFVPSYEADGYEDDEEVFRYWNFRTVFEFRKWARRRIKVLGRWLTRVLDTA